MGHYFFIQSVELEERPKDKEELLLYKLSEEDTLIEWKYEIPPMFFPLFSSEPLYQDSLIYCKGDEGLASIKKMYDFLEKHREAAFDKPDEFLLYKQKIIDYLDESAQSYYELNGTDVFAMSSDEDEFLNESKTCYRLMQEVNIQIQEAIEKDDIEAFLSIYTDAGVTHKSAQLRYFFNEEIYQYGYAPLCTYDEPEGGIEIITEDGKVGIKSSTGETLLAPTYDEIYGFGDDGLYSVVRNGDKYGHIDKNGKVVVPLIYDDAYDLTKDSKWDAKTQEYSYKYRAVVRLLDKEGVVDEKNNVIVPIIYDRVHIFEGNGAFPSWIYPKSGDKRGLLDIDGKEIYPFVIDNMWHPSDTEEDDSGFARFYERVLVKSGNDTYYLNPSLKPYGHNVEIIKNGLNIPHTDKYCFIAKNKDGKLGVITWEDEAILPFGFDKIADMYNHDNNGAMFRTTKDDKEALYLVTHKQPPQLLVPPLYDKLGEIIVKYGEDSYMLIDNDGKQGLYNITKNKETFPPRFESVLYGGGNSVFVFSNDDITHYELPSRQELALDFEALESALKWSESNKKAKAIFKKLKPQYLQKALELMFDDQKDIEVAQERYKEVNFLHPKSILDAANKLDENLAEAGLAVDDIRILFDAYKYHFDNKTGAIEELNWGMMNYFLAKMYHKKGDYPQAIKYAKEANTFIPHGNMMYVEVLQLICYAYYHFDKNEDAIKAGLEGLANVQEQRKLGDVWVSNVKKRRDMLDNYEETFNYYVGCACFYLNEPNYKKALEHITKSLAQGSDWNIYEKSYVRAISTYRAAADYMDAFALIEEVDELGKRYDANEDHCYIKYLSAFFYYHDFNDPQKAIERLEEALAIKPDHAPSLELKAQIQNGNKKGKGLFGFFRK